MQRMDAVPLRDGTDAMAINWLEIEIVVSETRFQHDPTGKVTYRNSFVTDRPVTKGYNLEHNFGHGTEHLSALLATMNPIAFAMGGAARTRYRGSGPTRCPDRDTMASPAGVRWKPVAHT